MYNFTITLTSASGEIVPNPVISPGDFMISTDGGPLSTISNTPQVISGTSIVEVSLTDQEVGSSNFVVYISDDDGSSFRDIYYHEQSNQAKANPAGPKSALPHVYPADGQY
jgi:hypothetical protein